MRNNKISDCALIDLPKIENRSGNITAIENNLDIPFEVKRIYYLYDIPSGESRGGHAHVNLQQLIIAVSGSFEFIVDDGNKKKKISLNTPNKGLLMPSGLWRELVNFSSGCVCLVLCSDFYDENDYIRDYQDFLKRTI